MVFLQEQIMIFAVAISFGIFTGVVFDFYRVFVVYKRMSRYVLAVFDFIFWVFITFLFVFILLSSNWGQIRAYIFFALGIGVLIHYQFISKFITEGFNCFFRLLSKILRWVTYKVLLAVGIIFFPLTWLLRLTGLLMWRLIMYLKQKVKKK